MNFIILIVLAIVLFGREEKKSKKRNRRKTGGLSNTTVMWLCPLFWPLLIAKLFFGGKQAKQDTRYADWEEFKKRNGK